MDTNKIIVRGSNEELNTLYQALALSKTKMELLKRQLQILEVSDSDRDDMTQRIEHFSRQLELSLTIQNDGPHLSRVASMAKAAGQHQGVRLHLPTRSELDCMDLEQGVRTEDYLQNTLVLGGPAEGKTQALLNGMADAAANPHIILVVASSVDDANSWRALGPNIFYLSDRIEESISWVQGQLDQRRRMEPDVAKKQKPIVFVVDSLESSSIAGIEPVLSGNSLGVYVYASMNIHRGLLKDDDHDSDALESHLFERVHNVSRPRYPKWTPEKFVE